MFFNFISGYHDCIADDQPHEKSEWQLVEDTLKLIEYLVTTGDFQVGRMVNLGGDVEFVPYDNGFLEFEAKVRESMHAEGLNCDALNWEFTIVKTNIGKSAPVIPANIAMLFRPLR